MTQQGGSYLRHPAFIGFAGLLLIVQYLRTSYGLDFSDEMQYYGQVDALLESGKLFTTDLFFQQSVYILIYPFIKIYDGLIGADGVFYFVRLIMAALNIVVFVLAYRFSNRLGITGVGAAGLALAMTFATTYHNIFSISYNTVSQFALGIFAICFLVNEQRSLRNAPVILLYVFLATISAFAHPLTALFIGFTTLGIWLYEREYKAVIWFMLGGSIGALCGAFIALQFADFEAYMNALRFSSGFGVGSVFASDIPNIVTIIVMPVGLLSAYFVKTKIPAVFFFYLFVVFLLAALGGWVFGLVRTGFGYIALFFVLAMTGSLIAYLRHIKDLKASHNILLKNLFLLLIIFGLSNGLTSGTGSKSMFGPLLLILPLLISLALCQFQLTSAPKKATFFLTAVPMLFFALMVSHWSIYPYRDARWFTSTTQMPDHMADFSGIHISPEKYAFLEQARETLSAFDNRKTLLTGNVPILYFALNITPQTCMFFMHSIPNDQVNDVLENCLKQKSTEQYIIAHNAGMYIQPRPFDAFLDSVFDVDKSSCVQKMIPRLEYSLGTKTDEKYIICQISDR